MASSSELRARVTFTGPLDDARLARLYAEAHCFVFPSLAEGFGFPPLEAMARGVPTAVSTAGSLPEVTADGALHFDPRDVQGLAELVNQLAQDADLRTRLSEAGREVAGRYRWSSTADQIWQEVRHALES
jgi:alpha-1,3-rhamnosyl/mannosyltransferase